MAIAVMVSGILFLAMPLCAQNLFSKPKVLNNFDGLPSNKLNCLAEDIDGFMWIGTDNGLSRFDGSFFENFFHVEDDPNSLRNDYILDVLPDEKNEKVWVAHKQGLSAYDVNTNQFKNYYHDSNNWNSTPDHRAYSLFKDQAGVVWIGFQAGGLLRYRPTQDDFVRYLCEEEGNGELEYHCGHGVVSIVEDANNSNVLWLATHNGLLEFYKDSGKYIQHIFEVENEILQNRLNSILNLFAHPNGKVYFGAYREGVAVFDIATKTFSMFDPCNPAKGEAFYNNVITSFYPISDQKFWVNSKAGVQLYDINTQCIEKSISNPSAKRYAFDHIDEQGRVWTASEDLGLFIYNPLFLQSEQLFFDAPEFPFASRTRKILEDTKNKKLYVLANASRGLYIYDQVTKDWVCIPPVEKSELYETAGFHASDMLFLPDGKLFIVCNTKFFWYEPGFDQLQLYHIQPERKNPRLRNIIQDHLGEFWISTSTNGLSHLDATGQHLEDQESILAEVGFRLGCDYMAEDIRGNIWIREHNGLLIFERAKNKYHYFPHDSKNKTALRGMGAIESDEQGNIWIAGRGDYLGHAHADSLQKGVLKFYGKKEGLQGNHVYLVKPHQNKLLVFTDVGLQIFDPGSKQFEQYYTAIYGFGENISTATLLSNGSLAVGNDKSINIFSPESIRVNEEVPKPYVSSFSVFDQTWKLKNSPSHVDSVYLSYKQNFFSFEFSSVAYNIPKETSFSYMLEGFDENWQDGSKRRFAAYTNVPGGDYRFIVKAVNNEGLSLKQPSITYLHISTVWYKTTWFWLLCLFLITALAYTMYKWRIGQVRKEERLKSDYEKQLANVEMSALRAQMNPHFIFNSLNSIEYYIINNDPEKASDYLNRFSRLIRLILQNSKNTEVTLKDDLEALKLYIEMEAMRFDDLFDYEVKIEGHIDLETIKVPPMLLQPYVENAIWHGLMQKVDERGKLELTLERRNGHLACFVEDNGIGREAASKLKSKSATKRKSYGMKITSDRLAMLNSLAGSKASVQVLDLIDASGNAAGTRVELIIPLKNN